MDSFLKIKSKIYRAKTKVTLDPLYFFYFFPGSNNISSLM